MRVGMIAPPWLPVPPTGYGGTELVIDLLARGLAARGHQVQLFTTGDARTAGVERLWEYPRALGTARFLDVEAEVRHVESAYRHLRHCDVIHDHTVVGPRWQRAEVPVVTTVHGVLDDRTRRWCQRYPANVATVAISASQRASAHEIEFSRVVHHGIELGGIRMGAGDGGYLLFLGRMSPDKGVHRAIEAARRAGRALVIAAKVQDPAEQAYFADVVEPMLGGDVEFFGEADAQQKYQLLEGAAALLNPIQWREPFGMVMIESLAVGTPVVATRWGAAPEIVEHGRSGLLCDSDDDLVDACRRVGALSRQECRRAVEQRFAADRMVGEYEALYAELLTATDQPIEAPLIGLDVAALTRHVDRVELRDRSVPVVPHAPWSQD